MLFACLDHDGAHAIPQPRVVLAATTKYNELELNQFSVRAFINAVHRKNALGEIHSDGDNGHDFFLS